MSKKAKIPFFLGVLLLIAGIYLLLLALNVIHTDISGFYYGKAPVLLMGLGFILVGGYIALYHFKLINEENKLTKILFLIVFLLILLPFNIILVKDYSITGIDYELIKLAVITFIFDILFIYSAGYIFYKLAAGRKF